jgi:trigger factor
MQVSVEAPTKLKRRLTITVPAEQLSKAYDERLIQLSKTAKVKGFRPGSTIPVSQIKLMYGESVRREVLSDVIQSSLTDALKQENLRPAGLPTIEPKNIANDQPLEYIASFDIFPEISSVKFDAKQIEKQTAEITEEDISKVIERLRDQHVTWKQVERAAQLKDQVIMDFSGSIDGKVFAGGEAHDYPVMLGSNTMIPGFEDGLLGAKAGDVKTICVTFPENYFAKEVAAKKAEFTVTIHKVSEPEFPEIDEDLVKKFGIPTGSLEELRAEISKNLQRELERLISSKLKAKVFDLLLEQNPLDVPDVLIENEAKRIHDEMHPHHGGKEHHHSDAEMAEFNEPAKRNVLLGLLVSEFVKQKEIKPDASRVMAHITKLSTAYENPAEVIKWYTSDKNRMAEIELMILEEQVIEKLLENTTVTEKKQSYSDFLTS